MSDIECCTAGLRTVAEEVDSSHTAHLVTLGMVQSASELLSVEPDIGVREMTTALIERDHFLDQPSGQLYVWGKSGAYTGDMKDRPIPETNLTTGRLALAVGVCATRDCPVFDSCIQQKNKAMKRR